MRGVLFLLLFFCGCGSSQVPVYPVRGRVQFADGEAVKSGTIELESVTWKTTATGSIQPDGSFVLGTYTNNDGAAAGEHRCIVVQLIVHDGTIQHVQDHGRAVSTIYADYQTSSLAASVSADQENNLLIVLPD